MTHEVKRPEVKPPMSSAARPEKQTAYLARDSIMKLLSDEEAARVTAAIGNSDLLAGDEYVDLQRLSKGIQRASGPTQRGGNLIAKKAVHEKTWRKIAAHVRAYVG